MQDKLMVRKRDPRNDMDQDFKEYDEEYPEDQFEIEPPMHEIEDEEDRMLTRRGFEKKRVDFGKYRGREWGHKKRGLPRREKSGPLNKTHGKSPFTYEAGIQLYRGSKSENISRKRMSWGVPWKR